MFKLFLILTTFVLNSQQLQLQKIGKKIRILVKENIEKLIQEEDTDGDKKITIDDSRLPGTENGDKRFWLKTIDGNVYEISGTYHLSNLLQELKLAEGVWN